MVRHCGIIVDFLNIFLLTHTILFPATFEPPRLLPNVWATIDPISLLAFPLLFFHQYQSSSFPSPQWLLLLVLCPSASPPSPTPHVIYSLTPICLLLCNYNTAN